MATESITLDKLQKPKGSAPGQYLGYGLQPVRLFYHLLTCDPEAFVGMEHLDDVSVCETNDNCILEQCKSALSRNPVSDASIDLWKTFSNWASNIQSGHINPNKTKFTLYVAPVKAGSLIQSMNDMQSASEITQFLNDFKSQLKSSKTPRKCDPYIAQFLQLDGSNCVQVIKNFQFISDSDPLNSIRNHLDSTIRPDLAEDAIRWGIGDAKKLIDEKIRNREAPILSAQLFRNKFRAFITAHDQTKFLHSLVEKPSDKVIENLMQSAPTFISQLDAVGVSLDLKTRAAGDYLWASADKTEWAAEGYIFEESLTKYDDGLKGRHLLLQNEISLLHESATPEKRGQLLYIQCCKGPSDQLEGRIVPDHFLTGSLNNLAERRVISWHPDYISMFPQEPKDG